MTEMLALPIAPVDSHIVISYEVGG